MKFQQIVSDIRKRQRNQSVYSEVIGKARQEIVKALLELLQKRKRILLFRETNKFSNADLIRGIDFYVVIMRVKRYTIPLSVTGPKWGHYDAKRHPDVSVISVDLNKPRHTVNFSVMRQLLTVFEKYI